MTDALPDPPQGFTRRPPTRADVQLVVELVRACELDDVGEANTDEDDVAGDWARPGVDLERDGVLLLDHAGEPVGYAEVFAGHGEGHVLPGYRQRGAGSWLAAWIECRAREQGAGFVRQVVPAQAAHRLALLERVGYERTDTAWVLQQSLEDAQLDVELPPGVTVRDFVPGVDDHAAWRLIEDAFSPWPNRVPTTLESWRSATIDRAGFEPWMFPLLERDGEVVGGAYCIDYPAVGEGWVQQLAVRADQRGMGLGALLLRLAFARFRERGRTRGGLSTDSRTGALGLYLRVGMHVRLEYIGHALDLTE